jgi:hypothetical protein
MSIKHRVAAAAVALTAAAGVSAVAALSASAATPACGPGCIEIFSAAFGTSASPNFVETVFLGIPAAGVPTILHRASSSDPAEDLIIPTETPVPVYQFYGEGMVSAAVNSHYTNEMAAQIEYAPLGVPTGLCAALATTPYQDEGLTLQPCSTPGRSVWIIDTGDSPTTTGFPLVNGATTDFSHPYGMIFPGRLSPADRWFPQIKVAHLIGNPTNVPANELWGADFGVVN